ncbi:NAD(P)-binding protein [Hymenopellis radicata]|nr:NAD(P)-binding protein [Hymenopellis radicata]
MINQAYPPKAKWSTDKIPDLSGKVVIVTGGNSGIGFETVRALLQHNAKVYVACRSREKATDAIKELKESTGQEAIFLKLDLQDLKSVQAAATEFLSKESELHILFNNAGLMWCPVEMVTKDGYDMQWGTHVVGHWYFTKLLIPTLIATAEKSPDKHVRVVNTATSGHLFGAIDFNTLKDGPARRKLTTQQLYFNSKLGNVILANEIDHRYRDKGIISTSLNPGNLRTNLLQHVPKWQENIIKYFIHPVPMGALTQLYAGTSTEGVDFGGKYLIPWARLSEPSPLSRDHKLGEEVWTWLEEQVKDL